LGYCSQCFILLNFIFFHYYFQLALQNKFNDNQDTPRPPTDQLENEALNQELMNQIRNLNQNATNNIGTTSNNNTNNLPSVNILTQR
jgi:hypothetical protein